MKNLSVSVDFCGRPYLIISCDKATDLNDGLCELARFSRDEILGRDIAEILSILRVSRTAAERLTSENVTDCWLFTKDFEPREVTISCFQDQSGGALYTFEEKPNSRLEEVLSYPCQLLEENMIGVSIYAAADFTLLKANQMYLDFNDKPFNSPEKTIGRSIHEFAEGYRGSFIETVINNIFITEKSEILKELEYTGHARGVTYWDQIITPVKADGRIKYVITNTQEVTERVLARKQFNEQNKLLEQKKTELAAIIENMSEALLIFDADGNYTMINKAARVMFLPLAPSLNKVGDVLHTTQFFDIHGNLIPPEENPSLRVKRGEVLDSVRIGLKQGSVMVYTDVNGMPLYDEDGRFAAGIMSCRDVTAQVKSEEQYKYLFEAMQSGVVQYDAGRTAVSMNPAAEHILGIMPEDLLDSSIKIQHPTVKVNGAILPGEEYPVVRALNSGMPIQDVVMEFYNSRRNEYRWISVNAVPLVLPGDTKPYQVFAVFDDITEQKKTEDALRESEARLRSVLENSNDIIYSYNMQSNRYEYVSPASETVLGYTPEEFMAIDLEKTHDMLHPDDRPVFLEALNDIDEKGAIELKYRQRTKNGEYRWFSNRLSVVRDEAARLLYRFGNIHDITEQVKNDAVIRYQANLLQNITDMVISTDENQIIKSWNKAAEIKYGWTEDEAIGQHIIKLLQSQTIDKSVDEYIDMLFMYDRFETEVIHTCKDGRKLNVRSSPEVIRDSNGNITGVVGIFHDITENKRMEAALRESEMHLRLAVEGGNLGIYAFDFINGREFVSDELRMLWGLKPGEPVPLDEDMKFFRGLHPDDKQELQRKVQATNDPFGDGIIDFDYRIILRDGTVKWLHMIGQTTFSAEGANRRPIYAAGVVMDITKRVQTENSIKEISEELRNIIESTDDFIWSVDRNYRLVLYNSAFERYIMSRFGRQLEKGALMADIITPENGTLWEDFYVQTAREGKYQIEIKTDNGARVISYSFNPVYIDSELVEITVFGKDITERINSEREIIRLNTSLEKRVSERTVELQKSINNLQTLSRIISHDLKEPIREIETLANQIGKNTDVQENSMKIRQTCNNMTSMIVGLSQYAMSAEHKIQKEPVNVKKMIISIYNDLKSALTKRSVLQFESGFPLVYADAVLFRQVLYNLLSNALKFSGRRDMAEISIGCVEENDQYVFSVKDNGAGFDMHYVHKLFSIFERLHTKDEFEGSGIGLAAVRNIIQRHGGRVWISSEENVGTVVFFTLPVTDII